MCTLCLSDMGELRDEWLREPLPKPAAAAPTRAADLPAAAPRSPPACVTDDQAVAA